ncbi:MAG: D-Ala-D-Ala carboxypeptidase family metallohydrolase [Bacteroidales bacterium]|nr:D-Ala-D-Ala carboxypeptidase family metallohydrolase [Bacteroidales bacterium]
MTKNFHLDEFVRSQTARRKGIVNTPDAGHIENLRTLCVSLLQPLRNSCGKPLYITSGYRCPELNAAVGGSSSSDHLKGKAADIGTDNPLALLAWVLRLNLSFDQAIVYPRFLHLSYRDEVSNRKQVLYSR